MKKTTSTNDKIEFIKELFTVILAFIVIGIFIFGILLLK
nr:MAG TPA: Preprotein translocase subunit secY, Preprotein Transport, Membrane Protein Complex.9A [Caudoviricetes sp.]